LRKARDGIAGETDYEQFTLDAAKAVIERDSAEDWQLISSPGRMRIDTVDAFGAGIARSLPLTAGLGGAGTTIADAEMNALYRDAAAATLDYLTVDGDAGQCVECALKHLDNNTSLYIDYIARMLASREQWLPITGARSMSAKEASAARRTLENSIEDIVDGQLAGLSSQLPDECHDELLQYLRYAAGNLIADGRLDHPLTAFHDARTLPAPISSERHLWQAIANILLIKDGSWRKSINKNDGFPAGDAGQKAGLYEMIVTLHSRHILRDSLDRSRTLPASQYSDDQWQVLLSLFIVLPSAAAELRRMFGERAVKDHTEVALSAIHALGSSDAPGEVAMVLDYRVQHLLIDEMQDTSIGQYALLEKLTAGWSADDGRTVFCVGDPMQSIYRFRDAEVGEFLQARKKGIGDIRLEPLLLRRNFRSGENLVHWFNTVFAQVMPFKDDISVGAISYSESVPVPQQADAGRCTVHPLFNAGGAEEAACTVGVLESILSGDLSENKNETIAILVRSRTQLAELLPALRLASIEYQSIEIDRLTDLPEVIDLIALTRALCHEGDRLAWLALLRGPWTGLCWSDLHALVRNDTDRTVLELCADPERLTFMSDDGVAILQRFLDLIKPHRQRNATMSLRDRVELAWFGLGGPSLLRNEGQLENACQYLSALENIEIAGSLDDVRELEHKLDSERVSSVAGPSCKVQIMTMHKAKGLQFDHVVLPGLGRKTRPRDRKVLSWLQLPGTSGNSQMIISPVGPRSEIEYDPLHRFIEATEADKDKLELDRLLYVACTRAKKSLHLIGNVGVAADGENYKVPVRGSLLHRLWPAIEVDYGPAFDLWRETTADKQTSDTPDHLVNPALRRFRDVWCAPVAAKLPGEGAGVGPEIVEDEKKVEFYWVGSSARLAGTIVHRWFQQISDGLVKIDDLDSAAIRAITQRWAIDAGVNREQLSDVCDRAEAAIAGILSDDKGRWLLLGEGISELAVTGMIEGRKESIIIDRVCIDDDGTHWIVDYKTSTHEGGDLSGFLRQESDRYRPQLAKYASLYADLSGNEVKTALYFPMLQAFCEVSVSNGQ